MGIVAVQCRVRARALLKFPQGPHFSFKLEVNGGQIYPVWAPRRMEDRCMPFVTRTAWYTPDRHRDILSGEPSKQNRIIVSKAEA